MYPPPDYTLILHHMEDMQRLAAGRRGVVAGRAPKPRSGRGVLRRPLLLRSGPRGRAVG